MVSRDGKTYTFTIRKGFGSAPAPVTAANYASAIKRVLQIRRCTHRRPSICGGRRACKAAGSQLIVRLTKRVPDFPARMTMPYLCPVPTDLPVDPEGVGAPLPGSGRYYVAEFVRGSRVVLQRNPYYRGRRPHHLDQIVVQIGDTEDMNTRKVEAGIVDVDLGGAASPALDELVAKYGVNKRQFFSVRSAHRVLRLHEHAAAAVQEQPPAPPGGQFRTRPDGRCCGRFGPSLRVAHGQLPAVRRAGLPRRPPLPVRYPESRKARALANGHTRGRKAVFYACDNALDLRCPRACPNRPVQPEEQIGIDVEIKQFPTTISQHQDRHPRRALRPGGQPARRQPWVDPSQY